MKNSVREDLIDDVANAIVTNKLVIFIGAGFAMNVQLPSWKELLENLINEYFPNKGQKGSKIQIIKNLIAYGHLSEAAERIVQYSGAHRIEIKKRVAHYLNNLTKKKGEEIDSNLSYEFLSELYKCGATKIVTTNYDDSIKIPLPENINILTYGKNTIDEIREKIVSDKYYLKIHGGVEAAEKMVLFEDDYRNEYIFDNKIPNLLQELFTHNRVLFLGCGLADKYMDVFEMLSRRNAVLPSYVVCLDSEINHRRIAAKNNIDSLTMSSYKELPELLEDILERVQQERQKIAKEIIFSDIPLETYNYNKAKEFFNQIKNEEVIGCYFFNTQVEFSAWFSPSLQLHLIQQMEATSQNKNISLDHYRILFLPYTKDYFFKKLKDDKSFLQDIKAMVKIHQCMNCKLVFITSDVFRKIIEKNIEFFETHHKVFGLDNLDTNNLSNLDEILKNQTHDGLRRKNDLDFSVTVANGIVSSEENKYVVHVWQANYDNTYSSFDYDEIQNDKTHAYFKLCCIIIRHIKENDLEFRNPKFGKKCLSDIIAL